jgi:hypothetical protein
MRILNTAHCTPLSHPASMSINLFLSQSDNGDISTSLDKVYILFGEICPEKRESCLDKEHQITQPTLSLTHTLAQEAMLSLDPGRMV